MSPPENPPQVAVWWFVGATFIFISPLLFFRDVEGLWLPIVTLILGLIAIVFGAIALSKEWTAWRGTRRSDPPS